MIVGGKILRFVLFKIEKMIYRKYIHWIYNYIFNEYIFCISSFQSRIAQNVTFAYHDKAVLYIV